MVDDTATLDLPWGVLRRLGGGEAAPALGRIGAVPLQQAGWSVLLRADLEDVDGLAYLVISVEGQSPPLRYTFDRRMRDWFSEDEGTEPTPESIGSCMVVPSDGRLASVLLGHTRSLKVALKPFSEDDLRAEGWGKIKRRPVTSLFSGRVSPLRVPLLRAHQEQDPPPMLDLAALPRLVQVPDPVGARPLQPGRGGRWDFAHPRPIPSYFTRQVHSSLTQTVCADNEMSDSVFSRSKLSVALEPLPGRGVMVDVVLSAAGQDFPAHRAVLAAASDVFLAMFTPQSKSKARVTIAGVSSPAVFQKFLDFFYTGALWNLSNMAADLLSLAERFQVEALKKHCQEQLFQDPPPTPVEAGAYIPNPDVIEPDRGGFIRTTVGEDNLLVEVPWSETPYRHRPSLLLPSNESISCEVAGDGNSLTASFQGKSVNLLVEVSREVRNCWSRQAPPPGRARNERFKFLSPEDCRHDATFLQRHTRSLAVRARLAAPIVTRPLVSLGLQRLRDRGALCDVVLSVAGEDFVAHRVVLAAGSEVFLTMFTGYFLENNESRVTIEDVASAAAFEKFLEFFYTGSVRDMEGYQLDLLQLADRYIMPALQDLCQSRVIASLDSSNAVAIFKTSVETTFVPEDVRQKAVQIMFQNWSAVVASEDWADFKRTHHDVARTLETASDVYRLRF